MKYPITFLFLVIIVIVGFMGYYDHERVHKEIFALYDVDSEIDLFSNINYAITLPTNMTEASEKCDYNCLKLHLANDMVAYNIDSIYNIISIGFLAVIFTLETISNHLRKAYKTFNLSTYKD